MAETRFIQSIEYGLFAPHPPLQKGPTLGAFEHIHHTVIVTVAAVTSGAALAFHCNRGHFGPEALAWTEASRARGRTSTRLDDGVRINA